MDRFKVVVKPSRIDGNGLFASEAIPARCKIGELSGEVISIRKARRIAAQNKRIAIVELDDERALYSADLCDKYRYINHSCKPNAYMRVIGHHVEFYALRRILKTEEITCNYGETHHEGKLKCRCGAPGCTGFL